MSVALELGDDLKKMREGVFEPELHPMKMLVVDDNASDLELLKIELENLGCIVDKASQGDDAMRLLKLTLPYDYIFLDLKFDVGQSGGEILRKMRRLIPKQPIAIVTGHITEILVQTGKDIGCPVFQKPISRADLKGLLGIEVQQQ